jgi:chromosome segregation ATPase
MVIIPIIVAFVFSTCTTSNHTAGGYANKSVIAEQRAEIEELKHNLADMGKYKDEVSSRIDSFTERVDSLTRDLETSLGRCESLEDIFTEIDGFIRELIDENNKLRNLQRTDWREDAGE